MLPKHLINFYLAQETQHSEGKFNVGLSLVKSLAPNNPTLPYFGPNTICYFDQNSQFRFVIECPSMRAFLHPRTKGITLTSLDIIEFKLPFKYRLIYCGLEMKQILFGFLELDCIFELYV